MMIFIVVVGMVIIKRVNVLLFLYYLIGGVHDVPRIHWRSSIIIVIIIIMIIIIVIIFP
jgi:hypothetical protein